MHQLFASSERMHSTHLVVQKFNLFQDAEYTVRDRMTASLYCIAVQLSVESFYLQYAL